MGNMALSARRIHEGQGHAWKLTLYRPFTEQLMLFMHPDYGGVLRQALRLVISHCRRIKSVV